RWLRGLGTTHLTDPPIGGAPRKLLRGVPPGLDMTTELRLPSHIGIILDGNGHWSRQRGLPRSAGHEHGAAAVRTAVRGYANRGIGTLTLYAFSAANWSHPKDEIATLIRLCRDFAERECDELVRRGVAVHIIGDLDE